MKECHRCKASKSLSEFYRWKFSSDGYRHLCKECYRGDITLKRRGLTPDEYEAKLRSQGGACAVCHGQSKSTRRRKLDIDHDHATGALRGLLCWHCNYALGLLADDPVRIEALLRYRQSF